MKSLLVFLSILLLGLQYLLWFGQSGHFTQARLQDQLDRHERQVEVIRERNRILAAEVVALKTDQSTLEARAREDLGMVKQGEVFFLVPKVD